MQDEQPLDLEPAVQRLSEDFDPLPEPASLEQMDRQLGDDYILAQEGELPFGRLIKPQWVPYRENASVVENPEATDVSPDPVPQPQIAAVSMHSGQGSGPQTPPEQRVSQRTTSSDNLRCREECCHAAAPG